MKYTLVANFAGFNLRPGWRQLSSNWYGHGESANLGTHQSAHLNGLATWARHEQDQHRGAAGTMPPRRFAPYVGACFSR